MTGPRLIAAGLLLYGCFLVVTQGHDRVDP